VDRDAFAHESRLRECGHEAAVREAPVGDRQRCEVRRRRLTSHRSALGLDPPDRAVARRRPVDGDIQGSVCAEDEAGRAGQAAGDQRGCAQWLCMHQGVYIPSITGAATSIRQTQVCRFSFAPKAGHRRAPFGSCGGALLSALEGRRATDSASTPSKSSANPSSLGGRLRSRIADAVVRKGSRRVRRTRERIGLVAVTAVVAT
jgi:hypothetical protein